MVEEDEQNRDASDPVQLTKVRKSKPGLVLCMSHAPHQCT